MQWQKRLALLSPVPPDFYKRHFPVHWRESKWVSLFYLVLAACCVGIFVWFVFFFREQDSYDETRKSDTHLSGYTCVLGAVAVGDKTFIEDIPANSVFNLSSAAATIPLTVYDFFFDLSPTEDKPLNNLIESLSQLDASCDAVGIEPAYFTGEAECLATFPTCVG
eukprot:m.33367 g.33367  ORF g.33367 m.33367 type:complete len:165 (+) comp15216_c0_seq1:62-556(+)